MPLINYIIYIFLGRIYSTIADLTAQLYEGKMIQLKIGTIHTHSSFHRAFFFVHKSTKFYLNEVVLHSEALHGTAVFPLF